VGPILATGTLPIHPQPGRIDFTPLVTVLVALLVVRLVLGMRLRWPVVAAVVAGGTILGWSIEAWGLVVPTAVAFGAAIILTAPFHRRARRWDASG
jgi:hypothetical protein